MGTRHRAQRRSKVSVILASWSTLPWGRKMYLGLALFQEERYRPRRQKRTEGDNTGSISGHWNRLVVEVGNIHSNFSKTVECLWRTEISGIHWGKARQNVDWKFRSLNSLPVVWADIQGLWEYLVSWQSSQDSFMMWCWNCNNLYWMDTMLLVFIGLQTHKYFVVHQLMEHIYSKSKTWINNRFLF